MHPDTTKMLFNKAEVCLAGSGRNTGIAKDIGEEYEITGYWNYATGATDATAFTANCMLEKTGVAMQNKDGSPAIISVVFLREEVILHKNWKSIGMMATASNGFEVKNLRINKNRCFIINESATVLNGLIYKYPFLHFAEATLAVNNAGMAVRFIDLCNAQEFERMAVYNKQENRGRHFVSLIEKAIQELQAARELFYATIQNSWDEFIQDNLFTAGTLQQVSITSKMLATTARRLVDELYPYCGLTAANPATEINRVWRNLHTASQHPLLLSAD
jgi:alkylation response protein AidB-like acyl-CoA dehydrogenase